MTYTIDPARDGLVVVDVQNDFCPGGSLAVPAGDVVVPVLNEYAARFALAGAPVFVTRDWHPATTRHFQLSRCERLAPWEPVSLNGLADGGTTTGGGGGGGSTPRSFASASRFACSSRCAFSSAARSSRCLRSFSAM